jgi:hypothetical protein
MRPPELSCVLRDLPAGAERVKAVLFAACAGFGLALALGLWLTYSDPPPVLFTPQTIAPAVIYEEVPGE